MVMSSHQGSTLLFEPGSPEARLVTNEDVASLQVPMPRLAGPTREPIHRGHGLERHGVFSVSVNQNTLGGCAIGPEDGDSESASRELYDALFKVLGDYRLGRVWNYIPEINATPGGVENYRAFNAGRLASFRERFGNEFRAALPAASALGIGGRQMAIAFTATTGDALHFENPEQVAACDYPEEFGAQPPAFARGTRCGNTWFLSGTAAVKGYLTRGETIEEQMQLTLRNIALMRSTMQVPREAKASWKVFVRDRADFEVCQQLFRAAYPEDEDRAIFLHADICRACLKVEVEGTFRV
jgi:chorismate lyase / 3-hydroxybenzoate synthase